MKNQRILYPILFFSMSAMAATGDYFENCNPGNYDCSPDHPAQVLYQCTLNFTGFLGPIEQPPTYVDSVETCVLVAAGQVEQCFEGGSEPQIQAFHGDIYTSLVFSSSGERMYWDFYVSPSSAYDDEGNTVINFTVYQANLSDLRPSQVQ